MTEKILKDNEKWELTETVKLGKLIIGEGAEITVPEGKQVTLTVDGIQQRIEKAEYQGDVVITVSDSILYQYNHFGHMESKAMSAAVCVLDGKPVEAQSVKAAVLAGTVSDGHCDGITVKSNGDYLGGIHVGGSASYVINDPVMELNGNGADDGVGIGAGIAVRDTAHVTVNRAKISNIGSIRTAIVVYGDSVAEVNDSDIHCVDGTRSNYVFAMTKAPWMLGIHGRVRATNLQDNATVTYNRCKLTAENWGAVSSDGAEKVRMYLNDCLIQVTGSGYGAYSIGDCVNTFTGCAFKVPDYAVICASDGLVTFTNTVIESGKCAVMKHGGGSGEKGLVLLEKGSKAVCDAECFQLKSCGCNIVVDSSEVVSKNGCIALTMINDDLNTRGVVCGPETVMEPPPGGFPKMEPQGGHDGPPPDGDAPGGEGGPGGPGEKKQCPPAKLTFKNTTVNGDMLHGASSLNDMEIYLQSATLNGAVSTAVLNHPHGMPNTPDQYPLVGVVDKVLAPNDDEFGCKVTVDSGSVWNVTKPCYLSGLTIEKGGAVKASSMTIGGAAVEIAPGTYDGKIVIK